jgi:hypothetical protein
MRTHSKSHSFLPDLVVFFVAFFSGRKFCLGITVSIFHLPFVMFVWAHDFSKRAENLNDLERAQVRELEGL